MTTNTLSETKKQHYLPFAYLKYFRCDPAIAEREKAQIYRDDGSNLFKELVANQCYKKWFYRRTNTHESESGFGKFEEDWGQVVSNARAGKIEDALLFMQMVAYHFRNLSIRYQIDTTDRYDAVQSAVVGFIEQKILRLSPGQKITDDRRHVTEFPWQVRLIQMRNPMLFTSDNPSVMTVPPSKDGYGPFYLPVSPSELLVGIDPTRYRFKSLVGSDHDAFIANFFVAAQGMRFIYLSSPMDEAHRTGLWKALETKRMPEAARGSFEQERFKPGHPFYGQGSSAEFQFLEAL